MTENKIEYICNILKSKYPQHSCEFHKLALAREILIFFFGLEWTNQAIHYQHPNKPTKTEEARGYLKSYDHGYQWQELIFKLAERVYNLQNVTGISRIIRDIKQGNLTSRYAELEAAKHLYGRRIAFDFVKPHGLKGSDFDIKIKDEIEVNCEVKHKIDSTKLSEATLLDTLNQAKTQVPGGEPSLLFIKISEIWVENSSIESVIINATNSFFKSNDKTLGIMFRWMQIDTSHEGRFFWICKFIKNNHLIGGIDCDNFIKKLQSEITNWISLETLINKYIID
ncbi:hypothetical protein HYV91_03680 [Candidatus Wolfebacteria bacterium]|nr:hypothetical protein [Candidatus Wolfebacteria bacterium]